MTQVTQRIRRHFDIKPAHHRPRNGLLGVIVIAVAALALFSAVTHNIPFLGGTPGSVLRAEVDAANQVNARTPVRVAGVDVGKVEKVGRGNVPGTALVTMRITDDRLVVKRDARADIRWRTLLGGNMYIDLQPGSASSPELGDTPIPRASTSSQVEFDDMTQIFDGGTAEAQRTLFRELHRGLSDPAATGRAVERLGPGLRAVGRGVEPMQGSERGDLRRLVAATARTVQGLGRDTGSLRNLITGGERVLAVTDARRRALGDFMDLSPSALHSTLLTMRRVRTSLDHLDPLVAALRPGARALAPATRAAAPALTQARGLLHEARPILRDAGPTFDALRRAGDTGTPLLRELDPTVRRLDDELLPFLAERDPSTRLRNFEAIGPFFSAVGGGAAEFNEFGNIIQFPVMGGPNSLFASSAGMTRACRREVPAAKRERCPQVAGLLTRVMGGKR